MGSEIGQVEEWDYSTGLRWELLEFDVHRKLQTLVRELNRLYRAQPALYEIDYHWSGFEWVDFHDVDNSIICFLRRAEDPDDFLLVCCNFTPVPQHRYRVGVPTEGLYDEIFNSDAEMFGGSNLGNGGRVASQPLNMHGRPYSLSVTLPPLAVVVFKHRP
jgi:1,4-alpha-glucan branching enzyme